MAQGRDSEIFGDDPTVRIETGGRPKVDRDKVLRLLKAEIYTTGQIAQACACSSRTVTRIREEMIEEGRLEGDDMKGKKIGAIVQADFEDECKRATGFSYMDWLRTKFSTPRAGVRYFNFARRCWYDPKIWDQCSLARVADRTDQLGDQVAIAWLNVFNEDKKRIRDRKKIIRFLFRFLGRSDINDKHLTMKQSRDPVQKREIPEITQTSFPAKFDACIKMMGDINPEYATTIRTKVVTMLRSGNPEAERGIYGLKKLDGKCWISMEQAPDGLQYQGKLFDKGSISWALNRLTDSVAAEVFKIYERRETGETIFVSEEQDLIVKKWGEITKKVLGRKWKLHDLRKVSATWYFALDVPLEILAMINVGWRDLNTIKDHYLQLRGLLKRSDRAAYAANIPEWFTQGIEEWANQ